MAESITVQIDFYGALKKIFGSASGPIVLPGAPTVETALKTIATTKEKREAAFSPSGGLSDKITILKNGRNITFSGGLDAKLENGDVLAIFPPTFGG